MSKTAWAGFKPPEWIDNEAFLFCGADPAWTPEKENRRESDPDGARGKCYLCGGEGKIEIEGQEYLVRIAIERGDPNVCGRCGRYGRQHLIDGGPVAASLAPRPEASEAATEKTADGEVARTPPPKSDPNAPVVACEDPNYVRRGDVIVPAKYAALLD